MAGITQSSVITTFIRYVYNSDTFFFFSSDIILVSVFFNHASYVTDTFSTWPGTFRLDLPTLFEPLNPPLPPFFFYNILELAFLCNNDRIRVRMRIEMFNISSPCRGAYLYISLASFGDLSERVREEIKKTTSPRTCNKDNSFFVYNLSRQ